MFSCKSDFSFFSLKNRFLTLLFFFFGLVGHVVHDSSGLTDPQLYGNSIFVSQEFDTLPEAPIRQGSVPQWRKNNRTLAFQFSPISNEGFAWITPQDLTHERDLPIQEGETKVYPAVIPGLNYTTEYRQFVSECFQFLQTMLEINASMNNHDIELRRDMRWDENISVYLQQFIELVNAYSKDNQRLADVNNIVRCFNAIRFQSDTKNNVATAFADWVNNADVNPNIELLPEIMENGSPLSHPLFWDSIYSLTLRNMTELCVNALTSILDTVTSEHSILAVRYAITCLSEYPRGANSFEFKIWKSNVASIVQSIKLVEDRKLRLKLEGLFNILMGDESVILSLSTSWFEAMCGLLCYADPTRKRLDEYYVISVEYHPVDQTLAWEEGCSAIIQGDFLVAIEKTESLDPFVAAFISEACEAKGLMDVYIDDSFTSVRNWLLINFSKLCLDDSSLAPAGIQLLQFIRTDEAKAIFAEYVPRMVLLSPQEVEVAINGALDFGLDETVRIIHKTTSKRLEAEGAYLEALIHLDNVQDRSGLRTLSWKLFEECLLKGESLNDALLNDAVNNTLDFEVSPVVRESLAPYAVLAKALEYLKDGSSIKAAKHLAALFRFPHIPVKYFSLLFLLMGILLDRQHPRVFTVTELVDAMKAVDKWEEAIGKDPSALRESKRLMEFSLSSIENVSDSNDPGAKSNNNDPDVESIIKNTRMKLAREVSRAYMENP